MRRIQYSRSTLCAQMISRMDFRCILLILIFSLGQMIWWGYRFGVGNHAVQIPFVKHILNPDLYPNDPMIATSSGYTSFFPHFIAILVKVFNNVEIIYFAVHLTSMFIFMLAIYMIGLLLFDNHIVAIIGLIFMFPRKLVLGRTAIQYASMYPTFVLFSVALCGIWFFLKDRKAIAFAIIGLVFNFHALTASYVFSMFALWVLLDATRKSWLHFRSRDPSSNIREIWLKHVLLPIGVFTAFALPTLIWSAMKPGGPISDEWLRILRIRSPHHSFPFMWSKEYYVDYLLFLALGALGLYHPPHKRFHNKITVFVMAIGVLCGLAIIFAEYYPVKLLLRMQLFRSTAYLTIFCLLYISNYIAASWGKSGVHKTAIVLSFLALVLPSYYNLAPLVLLLFVLAEWSSPDQRQKFRYFGVLLFVIFALVLRTFSPHNTFPDKVSLAPITKFLSTILEDRLLVTLICLAIIINLRNRIPMDILRKATTGIVILILAFHVIPSSFSRFHPSDRSKTGWIDAQIWAKKNTPIDAIFLTPPYKDGFRIFSERPIVVDWKDGTQQYFDTEYAYEWWERIQMVGGDSRDYDKMSEQEYGEVAKKYNASYLVVPVSKRLSMKQV